MTLTTDTPVNSTWDKPSLNDVPASHAQNNKSVECQLERTYGLLAETEANIEMFNVLMKLGLATNDVFNFVNKQTIHKRIEKQPDLKVQKLAMRSKLSDALAYSSRLRRLRDIQKARVSKKYPGSHGRRLLDYMVRDYRIHKKTKVEENRVKIVLMYKKN